MNYKKNIYRFAFFCVLFLALDYVYMWGSNSRSDYEALLCIMNDGTGYNFTFYFPGIIVTVFYLLGLNKIKFMKDSSFVIRNGKNKYIKYLAKDALIDAALCSAEFVAAEALICTIRFENALLQDTGFYWCCVLFAVMLCGYFAVVGITKILIDVIFGFGKAGDLISIVFFLLLNSLMIIDVYISPVYYASILSDWFENQTFNYIQYILNLVKCLCLFFAVNYLARIVYLRKDVIFNE